MENIRASEIQAYKERTYFGFSRFLLFILSLVTIIFTAVMVITNGQNESIDMFKSWPAIVALVSGGLLLIMLLTKKKVKQIILILLFIAFNVLLLTRVIDITDYAIKAREAAKAAAEEAGVAYSTSTFSFDYFKSGYGLAYMGVTFGTMVICVIQFVFTIMALVRRLGPTLQAAYDEKAKAIQANPEANQGLSPKKLAKKLNKLARKEKYVDYCHLLGTLCILDDPSQNDKYFVVGESKFKGSVFILALLNILWGLLNTITLGIMIPWTTAWKYKYFAQHSQYSGKKVKFDGKGIQLLGRWILWELLCIVTLGIYAFFMAIALKKWIVKHQHFEGEENVKSEYTGTTFGRGFMVLMLRLLQFITLGIATPFAANKIAAYDMEHTVISGHPLIFGGSAAKLFGHYMLWFLLSIVTIGIYALIWMPLNMTKYKVKYSRIHDLSYDPASDPR